MDKSCPSPRQELRFERLALADAEFVFRLYNQVSFKRFIGDKHLHSIKDAQNYLAKQLMPPYSKHGMGLYKVVREQDNEALGICGLVKRPQLPSVDLGFGYLDQHCGKGYAHIAAKAWLDFARDELRLDSLLAITLKDNHACLKLLTKLGFSDTGIKDAEVPELLRLSVSLK
ncbi:GNAT family N-acetyltransferase [Paraferrimonas sedimenticola]|uniref:N-acetyltransferase n=1 Tax=Paraferrimonas sedimenticola TaxID=375674 RepID=A0AA37W205_9GAMM|nr:GNAT family N-acetyltransferase [Paraferrimonas sedimenticola]GLP97243.1 N-acetyltransferase [Paraferrimonas sedimenticola]